MRYPFLSFTIALKTYLILVFFAIFTLHSAPKIQIANPESTLEISVEMVGGFARHAKEKTKNLHQKDLAKIARQRETKTRGNKNKIEPPLKNSKSEEHHTEGAKAKEDSKKYSQKSSIQNLGQQKVAPTFQPLPEIPNDLRNESFRIEVEARFYISNLGEVLNVELTKPCNNPKLNFLLLKSLKKWKFEQAKDQSTQDIRVIFNVD